MEQKTSSLSCQRSASFTEHCAGAPTVPRPQERPRTAGREIGKAGGFTPHKLESLLLHQPDYLIPPGQVGSGAARAISVDSAPPAASTTSAAGVCPSGPVSVLPAPSARAG